MFADAIRRMEIIYKISKNEKGLLIDVGCRRMEIDRYFKNRHIYDKKIIGVDLDMNSLIAARKAGSIVVCANVVNLPFKNNVFDSAICSEVLEHITNDSGVIKELARVLKSRAVCIVSVPYDCSERVIPFKKLVRNMYDVSKSRFSHVREGYNISRLKALFEKHSFTLIDYRYDLKLIGAFFTVFYYYVTNFKNKSLNEIARNLFFKISRILAVLFIFDDYIKKEGFTLFAKLKKYN